jgi:hypothetical protein
MRLAEVWMDDYKRFYYMHRHDLKVENFDKNKLLENIELFFFRVKILVILKIVERFVHV